MPAIDQHVLKIRSPVDGKELPCHVSAPASLPTKPLPVVFLLHDSLADPSSGAFVEEAFRRAAEWKPAMADGPPGLLIQPWGRGNGAWFGPGGRALFDVWDVLQDHFLLSPSAAIVGTGAGGCGAFQLAAHFPDRFHAVAAINPWTDDRLFLPLGTEEFAAWEADGRLAIRPVELAPKLAGKSVLIAHTNSGDPFAALAAERHFKSMTEALDHSGIGWRDISAKASPLSERPAEIDLLDLWRTLVQAPSGEHTPVAYPNRLFWRPLSIVIGTLGESLENDAMLGFAKRLKDRWLSGEDSCGMGFGDQRIVHEVPIVVDSEAVEETPDDDLVILGSPRLNLLAAKWSDRLPVRWPSKESDEFAILGRTFTNPLAFAAARGNRPDGRDGAAWIIAPGSTEAWIDVDRLRISLLPATFVQAKPGELLWMNDEE